VWSSMPDLAARMSFRPQAGHGLSLFGSGGILADSSFICAYTKELRSAYETDQPLFGCVQIGSCARAILYTRCVEVRDCDLNCPSEARFISRRFVRLGHTAHPRCPSTPCAEVVMHEVWEYITGPERWESVY
jgi:hypothetical protein